MYHLRLPASAIVFICIFAIHTTGLSQHLPEFAYPGKQAVFVPTPLAEQFAIKPVTSEVKKGILLFFMNPNGKPCQIQKGILEQNRSAIEQRYHIRYVNATNPTDRSYFYQFGVRGMPSIILLSSSGRIHRRFPPGILNGTQLLQAVKHP
jgi:hypothetical protein